MPGGLHRRHRDPRPVPRVECGQAGGAVPGKVLAIAAPGRNVSSITGPGKRRAQAEALKRLWGGRPGSGLSQRGGGNHGPAHQPDPALAASPADWWEQKYPFPSRGENFKRGWWETLH